MEAYYYIDSLKDLNDDGSKHAARFDGYSKEYDQNKANSYSKIPFTKGFPSNDLNLDYFYINDKDELTDVIDPFSTRHFFISPNFKELLSMFNLPEHKFYPARFSHRGKIFDYFLLIIVFDYTSHLNYQKSEFALFSREKNFLHPERIKSLNFNNKKELDFKWDELRKADPLVKIFIEKEKVIFNQKFNYDLFNIFTDFYVSDILFRSIIDNKITGLHIEASNLIFDKDQVFK